MKLSAKSVVLVSVQLVCLAVLLLTGPWLATPLWIWLEILGAYLGAWAFTQMKFRQLRIAPEPACDARLITSGPYRFIRHPMYSAVLLMTLAVVLSRPTPARLVVWAVLLGTLLLKLAHEETLLGRRFPEYVAYRKRSKRLVPFVY
jgi:protein-S-isoprenylcysteine O-methyltransferase Ste14